MNKTYEWLINNYTTSLHKNESVLELKYGWNYIQVIIFLRRKTIYKLNRKTHKSVNYHSLIN